MTDRRPSPQPPIVLVHGAWVGEWCWERVGVLLAAAGREVHAVTLRGHGVRRDESGPDITLGDHVADVAETFERHDLIDATLVGHSYGGRVITKAWPQVAARVGRMVYLDAHAPLGPDDGHAPPVTYPVDDDGMVPFADFAPDPSVLGPGGIELFYGRLVRQSLSTLTEPFRVELPADLDKTYVFATAEPSPQFRVYADAAAHDPAWRYVEVPATHWLIYTHPSEVARIILDPAGAEQPRLEHP